MNISKNLAKYLLSIYSSWGCVKFESGTHCVILETVKMVFTAGKSGIRHCSGYVLVREQAQLILCTVRTSRQGLCNKRFGILDFTYHNICRERMI